MQAGAEPRPPLLPDGQVLELARRYVPAASGVTRVFEDGYDHVVYCVDDALVVKVPRPGGHPILLQREALILKELAGTPGLPLPRLIGAEVGRETVTPHLCMSLVPGRQLEALPEPEGEARRRPLHELGRALAVLHRQPIAPFLASGVFDVTTTWLGGRSLRWDWERGVRAFLEKGLLAPDELQRLEAVYEQGSKALPQWPRVVLLHNDVRPAHVLVDDAGALAALIDFGDASLGPPEMDFFYMWLRWWDRREDVAQVLEGYLAEAEVGAAFLETVRFLRMVAAMRNADGFWCAPEAALAEVEGLAGELLADAMDESREGLGSTAVSTSEVIREGSAGERR